MSASASQIAIRTEGAVRAIAVLSQDEAFDNAARKLIAELAEHAKLARAGSCIDEIARADEAEQQVTAAGRIRQAVGQFLIEYVDSVEGWVGALDRVDSADFHRDPLAHFDAVIDAWEQFATEHQAREAA